MKKILFLFIFVLFFPVCGFGVVFTVTMKNSGDQNRCEHLRLAEDIFSCRSNGALFQYAAETVEHVLLNGKQVYPYRRKTMVSEDDLQSENCSEIIKSIRGPLLLEKNEDVYFIIGRMYEKGICNEKNLEKARKYYLNAGERGAIADQQMLEKHPELIKKAELDQDYLNSLQKNADEKRRLHALKDAKCQEECTVEGEVATKFRYNLQCYSDCMSM